MAGWDNTGMANRPAVALRLREGDRARLGEVDAGVVGAGVVGAGVVGAGVVGAAGADRVAGR